MLVDAFMKLKGIKGESTDERFRGKGVIQLESVRVGDASGETPWSKMLRAVKRILEGEEAAGKGGPKKGSVEAKLAKRDDKDRVAQDQFLEKIEAIDHHFGLQEFKEAIEELKKALDNVQSVGSTIASDIKSYMLKMIKVAEDEEEQKVKSGGQAKEEEAAQEKMSVAIHIRKMVDLATPLLFSKFCKYKTLSDESTASDVIIPSAKLWIRKAGDPLVYKEWQFRTLSVTAFEWTSREDGTIEENVSFTGNTVRVKYTPQDITGKAVVGKTVTSEWNFPTNTKEGVVDVPDTEVTG